MVTPCSTRAGARAAITSWLLAFTVLVAVLLLEAPPATAASSAPSSAKPVSNSTTRTPAGTTGLPDGFVRVKDGKLVIGPQCHEFFFAGWNQVRI